MGLINVLVVFLCLAMVDLDDVGGAPTKNAPERTPALHLSPTTRRYLDIEGRERFFHGVNVVYKSSPYYPMIDKFDPQLSFSQEDMELLDNWGINSIRLGVMWPGAEPSRDTPDLGYEASVLKIVNDASVHGIYSVIDAHQDVFSEKFCGEGVPPFAVVNDGLEHWQGFPRPLQFEPFDVDEKGIPSRQDCAKHAWPSYLLTFAVANAYQNLYENAQGIADQFAEHWARIANLFKGNGAVIGFELINEPFAGDVFRHPQLMDPKLADLHNLQPFYAPIAQAIREKDPDRIVMFESVTWADSTGRVMSGSGFTEVPGGAAHAKTSVYSYHYYYPANPKNCQSYLDTREKDAAKLKAGSFVTEFGLDTHSSVVMDALDERLISWTAWEYKPYAGALPDGTCTGCGAGPFNPDGSINAAIAKILSRPYAQAVAGSTIVNQFNSTTSVFHLKFSIDLSLSNTDTLVYVSKLHYESSADYTVEIAPSNAATFTPAQQFGPSRYVLQPTEHTQHKQIIDLYIRPTSAPSSIAFK